MTLAHRDADGDEADERDADAPLLPHPAATGGAEQPDSHAAVAGAAVAAQSDASSATSATSARASWRREVVAPALVAAARVSARLVSSSGPVAAQHARRGLRRGPSGSSLARRDVLPGGSGAAAVTVATAAAREPRRSARRGRSEPGGDLEEGKGEEDHALAVYGSPGLGFGEGVAGAAASVMEADDSSDGESGSQVSSDSSEGDSSANRERVS